VITTSVGAQRSLRTRLRGTPWVNELALLAWTSHLDALLAWTSYLDHEGRFTVSTPACRCWRCLVGLRAAGSSPIVWRTMWCCRHSGATATGGRRCRCSNRWCVVLFGPYQRCFAP
jgi:hypothetical protein